MRPGPGDPPPVLGGPHRNYPVQELRQDEAVGGVVSLGGELEKEGERQVAAAEGFVDPAADSAAGDIYTVRLLLCPHT